MKILILMVEQEDTYQYMKGPFRFANLNFKLDKLWSE